MPILEIVDLTSLERLASIVAEVLPNGTLVALNGTLGAGKTKFVQFVAKACAVEHDEVISPTFMICREYHGQRDIIHADAYRIRDDQEFFELGAEEWFQSSALIFLEWAEKVERCLPNNYVLLDFEVTGETTRRIQISAAGVELAQCVAEIVARFQDSEPS
jgi:tRNA threonylcarbamoyladenosine biosynthesis protein TsaE